MPDSISDFIKQDLAARLKQRQLPPAGLTLTALADQYGVSITPVRRALKELIDDRLLVKQTNGRLAVHPGTLPPPKPQAANETYRSPELAAVEKALTNEVLLLSLMGKEEYLREEATAERLGIGRTVLRHFLSKLAGSGLIEHRPRRGWLVRAFDRREMIAYLQVRETLELKALRLAIPRLDKADLERMLAGNLPEPGSQADRLDNDIHAYLIARSGNRFIREFFERHGAYHSMLFDFAAPGANVVQAMARQHRRILRALLAADWKKARLALARHIRAQRAVVGKLLESVRGDGVTG